MTTVASAVFITGILFYLWVRRHQQHQAQNSVASRSIDAQLTMTTNPLQSDGLRDLSRASLSGSLAERARSTAQRSSNLYILLRVLYQPVRILIGYIQVRRGWQNYSAMSLSTATVVICHINENGVSLNDSTAHG
jgi:hypothetical protein